MSEARTIAAGESAGVSAHAAPVRERLCSADAVRFFERWTAASQRLHLAEQRLMDCVSLGASSAARARVLESAVARESDLADRRGRRAGRADSPAAREAQALAAMHRARADALRDERAARLDRAAQQDNEAHEAERERDEAAGELEALRATVSAFGASAGEACLFFDDPSEPGACFLVPLENLPRAGSDGALEAFVLHRLAPGRPLGEAEPLRDVPPPPEDDAALPPETPGDSDESPSLKESP